MTPAQEHFSAEDKQLARLCERMGWTRLEFWAMPQTEQDFWMARHALRDHELKQLIISLKKPKYPDVGALVAAILEIL